MERYKRSGGSRILNLQSWTLSKVLTSQTHQDLFHLSLAPSFSCYINFSNSLRHVPFEHISSELVVTYEGVLIKERYLLILCIASLRFSIYAQHIVGSSCYPTRNSPRRPLKPEHEDSSCVICSSYAFFDSVVVDTIDYLVL